jgi:hypothetical protein
MSRMTCMRSWKSLRLTSHTRLGLNPQIGRPLSRIVVALVYFFEYKRKTRWIKFFLQYCWYKFIVDTKAKKNLQSCTTKFWLVLYSLKSPNFLRWLLFNLKKPKFKRGTNSLKCGWYKFKFQTADRRIVISLRITFLFPKIHNSSKIS